MNKYIAGFIAGFLATLILSFLMFLKAQVGLMPEFNVIRDINEFAGAETHAIGWIVHFLLGTFVWGEIFVLLLPVLKGTDWLRGIYFGLIAWALMMVGYMPLMGHGLFASELGLLIMLATLLLHILYGFVLGLAYGFLPKRS